MKTAQEISDFIEYSESFLPDYEKMNKELIRRRNEKYYSEEEIIEAIESVSVLTYRNIFVDKNKLIKILFGVK